MRLDHSHYADSVALYLSSVQYVDWMELGEKESLHRILPDHITVSDNTCHNRVYIKSVSDSIEISSFRIYSPIRIHTILRKSQKGAG